MLVQTRPPYALEPAEFRFRALAALAGQAPLGGTRELLMATLLAARLIEGTTGHYGLPTLLRRRRAAAARTWLSALALPATARASLVRVIDLTGGDDRRALADAWEHVVAMILPATDVPTRAELRRLGLHLAQSQS